MARRSVLPTLGHVAAMAVGAALVAGGVAAATAAGLVDDERLVPPRVELDRTADGSARLVVTSGDAGGADLVDAARAGGSGTAVTVLSERALVFHVPVVVRRGATLTFRSFDLRLASAAGRSADIVAAGGTVEIEGGRVSGWDAERAGFDRRVDDGRAHLRAAGGRLDVDGATLSHLGDDASGGAAVWVDRAHGSLHDVRVLDGERGVRVESSTVSVEASIVARTRREGLLFERCAGPVEVTDSRIVESGSRGVKVARGCAGARIHDNEIAANGEDGIELLRAGPGVEVSENRIHRSAAVGISVTGSQGVRLATNRVFDNGRGVVVRERSREVEVVENLVVGNRRDGVHLDGSDSVRLEGNRIADNSGPGVRIEDGARGQVGPANVVSGNLDGIRVGDAAAEVRVFGNDIESNAKDGFHLGRDTRRLAVADNRIVRNGQAAFSVTAEGVSRDYAAHNEIGEHPRGIERLREPS